MSDVPLEGLLRRLRELAAGERTDRELLAAFQADRDETAFAALVGRHGPLVLRVCRDVLGHDQDVEDVFQATFLVLARRAASIRKDDSLASWLYGVARRTALNARRDAVRRRTHERQVVPAPELPPSAQVAWREVQEVLGEEIGRLPEHYRAPFVLCFLEGRSRAEAARELGVKEGTVWSRLAGARRRLRERLARRGIELSAVLAAAALAEGAGATVPEALAATTATEAARFAAGTALAEGPAALAEAAIRGMAMSKVKSAASLVLVVGLLGFGAALVPSTATEPPRQGSKPAAVKEPPHDNGGRPDLLPPRDRWRTFAADVRRVSIDVRGRPWFEIDGQATALDIKRQTERACKLPAPWVRGARVLLLDRQGRVWLRPTEDYTLLLGYDPGAGTWIERRVAAKGRWTENIVFDAAFESKTGGLYFADRHGVHVWDGGQWSSQPLYRTNVERNLYYDSTTGGFDEPRFAEDEAGRVYVWTRWGRYGRTGTVGFFVHDGKEWRHRLVRPVRQGNKDSSADPDYNRLSDVIPLTGDRVLACTESGPALPMPLTDETLGPAGLRQMDRDIALLGDNAFRVREAAHERLAKLGAAILPRLREGLQEHKDREIVARLNRLIAAAELSMSRPEIDGHHFTNARVHGIDRAGNAWMWFNHCQTPGGEEQRGFRRITPQGKVLPAPAGTRDWDPDSVFVDRKGRLYLARYRRGCVCFDGDRPVPVTDQTQTSLRYVLGEDAGGRVYLTDERRVFAYLPGAADTRTALKTTTYTTGGSDEYGAMVDSRGRMWAFLAPPGRDGPGKMSVFEKGGWRTSPSWDARPGEERLMLFVPLRKGRLIVQAVSSYLPYFFDGETWHRHANLRELVEKRHRQLVEVIDNRPRGHEYYARMRTDADGRIWLAEWIEAGIWDGRRWLDLAGPMKKATRGEYDGISYLLPLPGGKEMLAVGKLGERCFRVSVDNDVVKVVPLALPGGRGVSSDYTRRSGLWVDGEDRLWLPRDGQSSVLIDRQGMRLLPDTGFPRLADSQGRVWLHNPYRRRLVVLDTKGRRGELSDDALGNEWLAVAEEGPGLFWVGTERGLLRVSLKDGDAGPVLKGEQLYEKDVPRGSCFRMGIDRERNLWFHGPGPDGGARLYRIELPR